ncbi:hypothetical protein [Allosphingosinicella sp.]|jgi:hypothetical protein|uniref:hypothetical protein n=1 Tax=Allosphingosinicella sp. TaxID=2823234 RepID=UPI002F01F8EF
MGNDALNSSLGTESVVSIADWVAGYCQVYAQTVLGLGALFLLVGLAFVALSAASERRKAQAEAEKAEAEARRAETEAAKAEAAAGGNGSRTEVISLPVVVAAAKGFAEVLGTAKAWIGMILIGLLLLWMAGSAPRMCVGAPAEVEEGALDSDGVAANEAGGNDSAADGPGNEAEGNEAAENAAGGNSQ